ncbi:regulatory-associated protein of mtor [Anaeramoeba flamelloides]|uniref:Regulatory-associated protein of mtor n=1 Tax=Anaeramoeba flamelloides TaxID=1746091 RepID=A0ABQ8XQ16_9EUKA|nr:regulatory-associated protein of mtor [Anaeramoeba flamelloides]
MPLKIVCNVKPSSTAKLTKKTFFNRVIGIKTSWNQQNGLLAIGGDSKKIKVWDVQSQKIRCQFKIDAMKPITCLKWYDQNNIFVGSVDGSINQFDIRQQSNSQPIFQGNEHESCLINLCFPKFHPYSIVSASQNRLIIFWDLRKIQDYRSFLPGKSGNLLSFDQHNWLNVFATSTKKEGILIYDWNSNLISRFRNYNTFSTSKIGNIKKIKFHPYRLLLGVASESNFSVFSPTKKKRKK